MPKYFAATISFVFGSLFLAASPAWAIAPLEPDPEPEPPRLFSPKTEGALIPRNSVFVFTLPPLFPNSGESIFGIINGGNAFEVELNRERCEFRFGCDAVVGPFDLNEGDELELRVIAATGEESFIFTASDEIDETAPTIEPTSLQEEYILASTISYGGIDNALVECLVEKVIFLESQQADDNNLTGPNYLVREVGARSTIIGTLFGYDEFLADSIRLDDLDEERCYRFVAWDVAGNKGESELACFDLRLHDDELEKAEVLEEHCAETPTPLIGCSSSALRVTSLPWNAAFLILLFGFPFRLRRS